MLMKKISINSHHQVNADGSSWEKHIVKVMCSSLQQQKKKPARFAPKTLFGVPQGRALGPKCFHSWLVFTAEAVISSAADKARTSRRTIASASRPPKAHTGTFYASAVYLRYKYFLQKQHVSYSHTRMSFRINILKPVKGLKWIRLKEKIRR